MTWKQPALLAVLFLLLVLAFYRVECAAVRGDSTGKRAVSHQGMMRRVFMMDRDASSFFKRRSRQWAKSQYEIFAEQREGLTEEKRREYFEEQSNKIENYMEEERDEQNERSRQWAEQWREFNYDGLFPSYLNTRLYI